MYPGPAHSTTIKMGTTVEDTITQECHKLIILYSLVTTNIDCGKKDVLEYLNYPCFQLLTANHACWHLSLPEIDLEQLCRNKMKLLSSYQTQTRWRSTFSWRLT